MHAYACVFSNQIIYSVQLINLKVIKLDQEKVYFSNRLEQHSKMIDNIRTQIDYPDNALAKELKDLKKVNSQSNSSSSPNCPEGMRLNEILF